MPITKRSVLDADTPLARARHAYFEQGEAPLGLVPEWLLRSWQRSSAAAAPAEQAVPMSDLLLASKRDASHRLRRHALPELEALAEALAPGRLQVLLADASGLILDAAGSDTFMTKAQRLALLPGVEWSERSRGTNAIGTALREAAAVTVVGAEHFLQQNSALGCTATPLLAPDGSVLGVLDVSGDPRCIQAQTISLVRMAGQMIEHRLALDLPSTDTEVLRFAHDPALLGSHREALLWVRHGQVVGANRAAQRVLGLRLEQLRERELDAFFINLPGSRRDGGGLQMRPHLVQPGHHSSWSAAWVEGGSTRRATPRPIAPPQPELPPVIDDSCRALRLERALRVLAAQIPVLIQGESGVGKEVFARQLHQHGQRRNGPFVAVNCAALPEGLIESELFGYEDGAFTGARRRGQTGLIREAEGGVLFLDEIGDMPLALQARLLRVLQDREVKPLGGGRAHSVDFALVCATHRKLEQLVESGQFRADLYFRLQHFTVELPPLRLLPERDARIDELLARMLEARGIEITPAARAALKRHDWPGNWRQLVALCQTLQVLGEPGQAIELDDLPPAVAASAERPLQPSAVAAGAGPCPPSSLPGTPLRELTEAAIDAALAACDGNVSRAARQLGVHRSTLYRRHGG